MKVTVYGNTGRGRFSNFTRGDSLEEMYAVEVETAEACGARDCDCHIQAMLNLAFRAANRVDGSAVEQVPDGQRSASSGDVFCLHGSHTMFYAVEPIGFRRVSLSDVSQGIHEARVQADPFYGLN